MSQSVILRWKVGIKTTGKTGENWCAKIAKKMPRKGSYFFQKKLSKNREKLRVEFARIVVKNFSKNASQNIVVFAGLNLRENEGQKNKHLQVMGMSHWRLHAT